MPLAVAVRIERDASLSGLNTLRVVARAAQLAYVDSEDDLRPAFNLQRAHHWPWLVLGGGSNVVLPRDYAGLVLAMRIKGVSITPADESGMAQITAAAGESWHQLVRRCLGAGLYGIENLALIPGTVGAAPMQNIGAYGAELSEVLLSVRVYLPAEDRFVTLTQAECAFSYRDSMFRHALRDRAVITAVTLQLQSTFVAKAHYPDIRLELVRMGKQHPRAIDVAEAVIRVRRRKLPAVQRFGNVGSFFKNPVLSAEIARTLLAREPVLAASTRFDAHGGAKLAAAALIEQVGWKGRRVGDVAVWHRQPLVLINRGAATADDVLGVARAIAADVQARFGVTLAIEPRVDFDTAPGV